MADKPQVIRDTDDEARKLARILLRGARSASLAVLEAASGHPSVSRVLLGIDTDGVPVILVSALSNHTTALLADSRASLLAGEPGKGDPLAHPRLTLQCMAERVERATGAHGRIRQRFVRRHPKSKLYVDFPDFAFFRLLPVRASLNGGFGRAYLLDGRDFIIHSAAAAEIAGREDGAIEHMNKDHSEAIALYARFYAQAEDGNWRMTGLDADGFDLADGDNVLRVFFREPLTSAKDMHMTLVHMAGEARAALES